VLALEDQANSTAAAPPFDDRLTLLVQREIGWRVDRRVPQRLRVSSALAPASPDTAYALVDDCPGWAVRC
jgi:hypothetical protein